MEQKRMTFMVTPDVEHLMDEAKKILYDKNRSEMIRTLLVAGLDTANEKKKNDFTDSSIDYGVEA